MYVRRMIMTGLAAGMLVSLSAAAEHYKWDNVAIGGGGFVSGIVTSKSERGVVYARTDVGGAYRYDSQTGRWIALTDWLSQADQAAFARAARPVVAQAANDEAARAILQAAAAEISLMIATLDPAQRLPLALCGGLAAALQAYLDPRQQARIVAPQADAVDGALLLAQRALQAKETPA